MSPSLALSTALLAGCLAFASASIVPPHDDYPAARTTQRADTLPPFNSIPADSIDSVDASFKAQTITLYLKDGSVLTYQKADWKPYSRASLNPTLKDATDLLTMTFTKAEHAPAFPGGEPAWDTYLKAYCRKNKAALRKAGGGRLIDVQFIVDHHGNIYDVEPIGNAPEGLAALAVEAITTGPQWVPATQNGRKVVCYMRRSVKLEL